MSEAFSAAERVSVWTQPRLAAPGPFTAWGQALRTAFEVPRDEIALPPEPVDMEGIAQEAYEIGHAAGLAAGRAEAAPEIRALHRLAEGLETLRPEPVAALGGLIAATVERLLTELMGSVEIDRATLLARAEAVALLIGEETRPAVLKLNPADLERLQGATLPVALEADPAIGLGGLRLETAQGWIEDGPAVRLEKLRAALDRVTGSR